MGRATAWTVKDTLWSAAIAALLLAACMLLFYRLGDSPFWDYDEAIYANVIHDTQASGEIGTLSIGGRSWFEKPPLYFWASMGAETLMHSPEWSYRITAALAGLACLIFTMLAAWEISGSLYVSFLAGVILLTTGPFIEAARQVRLDIPVVAMIMLAVWSFLRGNRSPRWYLGVGVAIALGFLFKSVIAALAGVFIFIWAVMSRDFSWLKRPSLWWGILAGALILVPWHLYETLRYGTQFWDSYFLHAVLARFSSQVNGSTMTLSEYVSFFLAYTAPWGIAYLAVCAGTASRGNPLRLEGPRRVLAIYAFTAMAFLVLFAISSTRIFYYLLPAYPFMAIAVALAIKQMNDRLPQPFSVGIIVGLIGFALWVTINYSFHIFAIMRTNDVIVADEQKAGLELAKDPLPEMMYAYEYDYWDTIKYYSGRRDISVMSDDTVLDRPFILLTSTPYMQWHSFDPELQKHLSVIYQGPVVTLYRFQP